jgi:hypothetical protein
MEDLEPGAGVSGPNTGDRRTLSDILLQEPVTLSNNVAHERGIELSHVVIQARPIFLPGQLQSEQRPSRSKSVVKRVTTG